MEGNLESTLQEFRNELQLLVHKSQDDFEKQLVYLSAGGIAISMAFVEKLTGQISLTHCKVFLISGWVLLALTLLINLASHVTTIKKHNQTIKEIDDDNYDQTKAIKRNKMIGFYNRCSLIALFLGIIAIISFVFVNI